MSQLVYCTRHAAIRTVGKLMKHLERLVQDLDDRRPLANGDTRFERLRVILQVCCN
jgi:hypothetical protein